MKAKHTPGKWEITVNREYVGNTQCAYHLYRIVTAKHATEEQAEANARLIAKSPELISVAHSVAGKPKEALGIMEAEGLVIKDMDDKWQKLAFTLYSMLVSSAGEAERIIAEVEEEN